MWSFEHEGAEPVWVPRKMAPRAARKGQIYRAESGTIDEARDVYGVAIDRETRTVIEEETVALRGAASAA
jgi:hypothetical protein